MSVIREILEGIVIVVAGIIAVLAITIVWVTWLIFATIIAVFAGIQNITLGIVENINNRGQKGESNVFGNDRGSKEEST